MKYDEKACIKILKKHGWNPMIIQGHTLQKDWISLALQLFTLEKLGALG